MKYFLDTSALFKRYIPEPGSETLDALMAQGGPCHISVMTVLELVSNLQRLRSIDGVLSDEGFEHALIAFRLDVTDGTLETAGATPERVTAATDMLASSYMTPVDALQIATAKSLGPETVFVSSDHKLNGFVRDAGMHILDPCKALD